MVTNKGDDDILTFLHALAEAFNAHDIDRIMSLFSPDAILEMPRGPDPDGKRYVGYDAVRKGILSRFENTPDVHYGDIEHFVSGNCGMSKWLLTGTKISGEKVKVRGCDFYTFENGKVQRKDSYWKIVEPDVTVASQS